MKTAIVGSRNIVLEERERYLPDGIDEIISGGAKGIDRCAREYAKEKAIKLTEFLPEYQRYGRGAPLKRNDRIIDYADMVIVFWDGESRGTRYVIDRCREIGKNMIVYEVRGGVVVLG